MSEVWSYTDLGHSQGITLQRAAKPCKITPTIPRVDFSLPHSTCQVSSQFLGWRCPEWEPAESQDLDRWCCVCTPGTAPSRGFRDTVGANRSFSRKILGQSQISTGNLSWQRRFWHLSQMVTETCLSLALTWGFLMENTHFMASQRNYGESQNCWGWKSLWDHGVQPFLVVYI